MTIGAALPLAVGPRLALLDVVALLGVRFRDFALDRPITDGLVVAAIRAPGIPPLRRATPTASGAFAFRDLPGLRDVEYPADGASDHRAAVGPLPFVVMVLDTLGRFLPAVFTVDLPFVPPTSFADADPAPILDAYLFSAPTRPVCAGMAAIRADVWDRATERPAAWTTLRVDVGGRRAIGVADAEGRVLVLCPEPLLERLRVGSPPGTDRGGPHAQGWGVQVRARYAADLVPPLRGADVPEPWPGVPSLKAILEAQPPASIWMDGASAPVAAWMGDLTHGEELVARSAATGPLWISRESSLP